MSPNLGLVAKIKNKKKKKLVRIINSNQQFTKTLVLLVVCVYKLIRLLYIHNFFLNNSLTNLLITYLISACIIMEASSNMSNAEDLLNSEPKFGSEHAEKLSAVWTTSSTSILLKLYEDKLEMLETPKKKKKIWIAISDHLKEYNIDMTPDQVRWKINALTKRYKQCIDSEEHDKFKYFKEMDSIYSQYKVDCDSYTIVELKCKKKNSLNSSINPKKGIVETKAVIELRKIRLANRIESDRTQSKIQLEKQWLEYLQRQEEQKSWKDEIIERNLKLHEEELELWKREMEVKESLEFKNILLMEKDQDLLHIEREKCELLKQIFTQ